MQTSILPRSPDLSNRIVTVLQERHKVLSALIPDLQKEWSEEGLHNVRVACRRLRSTIRTFLPFLDRVGFSKYDNQLKRFMKKFNEIRDLDVQLEQFETLRKPVSRVLNKRILHIRASITERRHRVKRKLHEYLQEKKLVKIISLPQVHANENQGKMNFPTELLIPEAMEAWQRYSAISWDEGSDNSDSLHALRIQIKRVRYGAEIFLPELGKEGSLLIQQLKMIQDFLGWIHDCDVFCEFLKTYFVQEWQIRYRSSKKFFEEYFCPNTFFQNSESLPNFQKMDLFQAVHFLFRQITRKRTKYVKLAKKKFDYFERRDWSRSLKEWFETGNCPKQWK